MNLDILETANRLKGEISHIEADLRQLNHMRNHATSPFMRCNNFTISFTKYPKLGTKVIDLAIADLSAKLYMTKSELTDL
jgi:hypothetical protein